MKVPYVPVSYTHLDVYKRQSLYSVLVLLPAFQMMSRMEIKFIVSLWMVAEKLVVSRQAEYISKMCIRDRYIVSIPI